MELSIWDEIRDRLNLSALGKPAIIGIAALLAMVAVFAGKNLIETATASDFQVDRAEAGDVESSESNPTRTIFVHVSGGVKAPGIVEVPWGSRVVDAVQAVGGFSDDARADSVNLARPLEDGEQIFVAVQQSESAMEGNDPGAGGGASAKNGQGGGSNAGFGGSGKVNLNTASESELESLPGIGPSTAAKIVSDRMSNGSYKSVDDLARVSGIGEKKLESIRDLVYV